jgi:hypothetical protein
VLAWALLLLLLQEAIEKTDANGKVLPEMVSGCPHSNHTAVAGLGVRFGANPRQTTAAPDDTCPAQHLMLVALRAGMVRMRSSRQCVAVGGQAWQRNAGPFEV